MKNIGKSKVKTLIALVITIIILLILAGVTIATLTGDNGVLTKASEAKQKTEEAQEEENLKLAVTSSQMKKVNTLDITKENLENAIKEQFGNNKDFLVTDNGDGSFLVNMNDTKRMYYVDSAGEVIAEENMLKISTANELKAFRDDVNSGNTYAGKYVYLANDITLDINEEWEPIGIYQEDSINPDDETNIPFKGIFDGGFNTISELHTNSTLKNRGLFGLIKEATIKNVGIINGDIQATSRTGAIVGYAYQNSKILNCYNSSNISATDNYIGGIAGYIRNGVILENCYNTGNVISFNMNDIGGIVGENNNSTIKNCYNTGLIEGNYVGGISGSASSNTTIENCYNVGILKASTLALSINCAHSLLAIFKNNYYLENTVNGSNDLYAYEECKAMNSQELKGVYVTLGNAFKEDANNINNGYPILSWQ